MSAHEFPSDIAERREWGAKGEPYPTEELARQQVEALQDEAVQYWVELPLIDELRTTAFQLRGVLANRPVNQNRLCYVRPPHTRINSCLKLRLGALITNHTPIDKGKSAKTIRQLMGVAWPEQRPRSTCS